MDYGDLAEEAEWIYSWYGWDYDIECDNWGCYECDWWGYCEWYDHEYYLDLYYDFWGVNYTNWEADSASAPM